MNKQIVKDASILMIITLIAGLLLGLVYEVTIQPIKEEENRKKQEAYSSVFQDAHEFVVDSLVDLKQSKSVLNKVGNTETIINEVFAANDSKGQKIGYVMSVTNKEGYSGDITLSVGIKLDGTINGYEILVMSETVGLGMNAKEEPFKNQFKDKKVEQFHYTKTGAKADNEIDALSGATITTNAVTNGINGALEYFSYIVGGERNE